MHAPHTYNPAELGNFNGDHRFIANHRSQWYSVTVPFRTFSIMADSRKLINLKGLATGASVVHDVTGDSRFSTTGINAGLSYTIDFVNDSLGNFAIAVQPSFTQKKLDMSKLNFDNQFNGNYFDPGLPVDENLQRTSRWYLDVAVGVRTLLNLNVKNSLEVGVSAYNLLRPKQSFFNEESIRLDPRYNGMLKWNHLLKPRLLLQPGVLYSRQGEFSSLNIGVNFYYDLSESIYLKKKIFGGIYGRTGDSGDLMVGMIYDRWTLAGSYDFNFSGLVPASNYDGGFEIAIIYIISKLPPKPQFKSCPPYL